jgi:hypothetical protein
MTAQAERIKAAHRGVRQAEPASRSRVIALNSFGLKYERIDDFNYLVEGEYLLNVAMSYWRSETDPGRHGYLVSGLNAEIKRNSRKPVAGRESVAADRPTPTDPDAAIAESATGAVSASLIPEAIWP